MNNIVDNMVKVIEELEKDNQVSKINSGNKKKKDIVKAILQKLDEEVKNENQKNRI